MSQDHLFSSTFQPPSQPIFDPSLYPNDISLQFASSVPQRPQYPLHFPTFHNQNPAVMSSLHGLNAFNPPELPKQQSKAERRAEHNATERARRENLNAKFQQLAHTLPNLQNDSRNSKSAIIDRTLDYINNSVIKEEYMQTRIKELETINRLLLDQLSERTTKRTRSQNVSPSPEEDFLKIPKMYYADMNKLDSRKFEEPTFSLMDQRQFN